MSEAKRTIKDFLGYSIGPIVNALIGFISVPITTRIILPQEMGKASMFTTAKGLIVLILIMGFDYALLREFGESKNKKKLLFHVSISPLVLSILFAVIALIFYKPLSILLFGTVNFTLILLLGLNTFIEILFNYSNTIIRMSNKARIYSFYSIFFRIVSFVATLSILLLISPTFESIIYGQFLAYTMTTLALLIYNREIWSFWKEKFDRKFWLSLLRLGIPLMSATLLNWLFNSMDKIALRSWSSFNEIGIYAGASKIVNLMNVLKISFSTFWLPTALRWLKEEKTALIQKSLNIMVLISGLIFLFITSARFIIIYLLGSDYQPSRDLIPFLLFVPLLTIISEITVMGLHFEKKSTYHIPITIIASTVNLLGNFLLVPLYGAKGAAIATGVSYFFFFFFRSYFSRKVWKGLNLGKTFIAIGLMFLSAFATQLPSYEYIAQIGIFLIFITLFMKEIKEVFTLGFSFLSQAKKKSTSVDS